MLVDEVTFTLFGGDGGRGAVAFNKVRLMQGPVGGDGGDGGSIWFEGVRDIGALGFFANKKEISAANGRDGRGQFLDGRRGDDLTLRIPVGTSVIRLDTAAVQEMTGEGQRILAVQGGRGGRGNFKFRSSVNTSPKEFEEGTSGEEAQFRLELRLIADVGLVGLPNAGKSSLLNELTAAKSKVGRYAFTTLEPHLGAYHGLVIADIPGLIEGASSGKGLGVKFLKHIERTKTIFHLVSAESADPLADYRIIRSELEAYGAGLSGKQEHVFLTKSDTVSPEELREKLGALERTGVRAVAISVLDEASLEEVKRILNGLRQSLQ